MLNQAAWLLIVFYYHYLCRLSGRSASSFLFLVLFILPSKHATLQATGRLWLIHIYSVWSLAGSLAALCVGVGVLFFFFVSCISGPMQLYWLLAWSLVSNQGFLGKSYPGAWSLVLFLMEIRVVACVVVIVLLCTCIFYSGFLYLNVFNVLNVLLLIFLVVLNVCTVNKVSFVSFLSNFSTVFHLFCCRAAFSHFTAFLGPLEWILLQVGWVASEH